MKKNKSCLPMLQKYIAELFGTFTLTFLVALSIGGDFPIATPLLAGLVLATFVYTIGAISGCHINPAVTIGLWTRKKICSKNALLYIASQFSGAALALLAVAAYAGDAVMIGAGQEFDILTIAAEAIGMMLFTFGISAAVDENVPPAASGITVGASLFLGVLIASVASNGVLNPAVALGIGSFSVSYLVGPIIGSIAGFWLYQAVNEKK